MNTSLINIIYIAASVLFILAIKGMSHPRTAVRGNLYGAVGMLIAVLVLQSGAAAIRLPRLDRFAHALAGITILACGVLVKAGL